MPSHWGLAFDMDLAGGTNIQSVTDVYTLILFVRALHVPAVEAGQRER